MRAVRPLSLAVATVVLSAGSVLTASASAAGAVTVPAQGSGVAGLRLLMASVGGERAEVGLAELVTSTLVDGSRPTSEIVVTPVQGPGGPVGRRTITPDTSPGTVAPGSPVDVAGLLRLAPPSFAVSASGGSTPTTRLTSTSLGSVTLLGLPLALTGSVDVGSAVNGTAAGAGKVVRVDELALPDLLALLGALGLDLPSLPTDSLLALVDGLVDAGLLVVDTGWTTAAAAAAQGQAAVDAAQAEVDAATGVLTTRSGTLAAQQAELVTATTAMATSRAALQAAIDATPALSGVLLGDGISAVEASSLTAEAPLPYAGYTGALAAADTAAAAVATAQAALDAAQAVLDDLTTDLAALLATLADLVRDLLAAVDGLLGGVPLAAVEDLVATTRAVAGADHRTSAAGTVGCVRVLGIALAGSCVDTTLPVTAAVTDGLTLALAAVDGVLASVLTPLGASVPVPTLTLLAATTSSGTDGAFDLASAGVDVVRLEIPAVTVPAALAVPVAAPGASALGLRDAGPSGSSPLAAAPSALPAMTLALGTLADTARFAPGVAAAVPSAPTVPVTTVVASVPTGTLPATGGPAALALGALVLVGAAVAIRRRLARG